MNIQMQLRVPHDDLTALDQLRNNVSRSQYVRKVLMEYANDRAKLLGVLDKQLEAVYGKEGCESEEHDADD